MNITGQKMGVATKNKLIDTLVSIEEQLLKEWKQSCLKKDELNDDLIFECSIELYKLVQENIARDTNKWKDKINGLAKDIAERQLKNKKNIGDLVLKVSLGKTIIFNHLTNTELNKKLLQAAFVEINSIFDQFLYDAVTHYTYVKDKIIEEKTNYIDITHKDRLTILGQMTSSFIHEFRNPLTSIQGFVQLLKGEYPDMKYLNIISSEIEQLNFQISQFLLLSKKELIGKEKTVFSLNDMLEEVLLFLYPSILDGNVKVIKDIQSNLQLYGYADELRQVFINIIFNAIDVLNHNRENPEINIIAAFENDKDIRIHITNNGPQIPEHLLATIFEPFVTTKKLGTGLGLFICREIIEKHKGSLDCVSKPTITIFKIKLPAAKHEQRGER